MTEYLGSAEVLTYKTRDDVKACVSRGAAWQALSLVMTGAGLVRPVSPEAIAIRTAKGPVELVARGAPLPYPAGDGPAVNRDLRVPETSAAEPLHLRVEVIAAEDERPLLTEVGLLDPPLFAGDELELRYRLDENQKLEVTVAHGKGDDAQTITFEVERPLTNVVSPEAAKLRIEDAEERLRTGEITGVAVVVTMSELAGDYAELGQREKSLEYYARVLRRWRARTPGSSTRWPSCAVSWATTTARRSCFSRRRRYPRGAALSSTWRWPADGATTSAGQSRLSTGRSNAIARGPTWRSAPSSRSGRESRRRRTASSTRRSKPSTLRRPSTTSSWPGLSLRCA